jgi:hypothetical protein
MIQTAQEKAGELSERARTAAAQSANPFSAAIEAGKEAYKDEKRKNESRVIAEGRPSYPVKEKSPDEAKDKKSDNDNKN